MSVDCLKPIQLPPIRTEGQKITINLLQVSGSAKKRNEFVGKLLVKEKLAELKLSLRV